MPFFVAYIDTIPVGFMAIKEHNLYTSEIYIMGVLESYHRRSIGQQLLAYSETYCRKNNIVFLTVKTLADTSGDVNYEKTRKFYDQMGFKPLEIFPTLWDANNPCLFMAKYISNSE